MGVEYSGSGESLNDPIQINGIQGKLALEKAEIAFIESSLGTRGVHWFLRFRAEHQQKGKMINEIGISAHCGHITSFFFTINI